MIKMIIIKPSPGNNPGIISSILLKAHTKRSNTVIGTIYNSPCKIIYNLFSYL